MAKSRKTGREYQSRWEAGYRTTKYPKGFDSGGYPIGCDAIDTEGNKCPAQTGWGFCEYHREELDRQTEGWPTNLLERPEVVFTPPPKAPKKKRGGSKKGRRSRPVIAVKIDPNLMRDDR
jgi:hypothetical protein